MMSTWAERLCCPSVAKQRDLHTQTDIMTTHVLLHDVLPGPALCSFGCAPLLWLTLFSLPSALVCATVQQSPNAFVKNSKQSEDNERTIKIQIKDNHIVQIEDNSIFTAI